MSQTDDTIMKDVDQRIYLTLVNNTGYIFNVDDYMTLRKDHRIVGALVGTSGTKGWSANECTLPVALTEYETRLLIEKNLAVLVSKSESLLRKPTCGEIIQYKKDFESRILEQKDALKAEKLKEVVRNMPIILEGKRKKLITEGEYEEAYKLDAAKVLKDIGDNLKFERKNYLLEITCGHPYSHVGKMHHLPPMSNSFKYRVFRDLWQRGKYVTSGDAFGCDFLVYPGDPLLYHASHIVILLDKPKLDLLSLIAKVRLSVSVNKVCIFAYDKEESPPPQKKKDDEKQGGGGDDDTTLVIPIIEYQTFKWDGNRDKREQNKDDHIEISDDDDDEDDSDD